MNRKKKKVPAEAQPKKSSLRWMLLAFVGLAILAGVQYIWQTDLCVDGSEISAEVRAITSNVSEDHEYGRSIKIYNLELRYTVAGKPVMVIKTFNDAQAGELLAQDLVIGDTVVVLVDENKPRRFKLRPECE